MPYKNKDQAREYWRKYRRKWRAENREHYLRIRREHYGKNRQKMANQQKKWQEKHRKETAEKNRQIRLEVLTHYGGDPPKCACCGETEIKFLTIDHIDGGGNKLRGKQGYLPRWLKVRNFPKGYQVLCFNCNCAKGIYGICPHEKSHR